MGRLDDALDRHAPRLFIGPAVLVILAFSIFPLITSVWLSLTRFSLQAGGWDLKFIGALNYKRLFFGSQQFHMVGTEAAAWPWWGWPVLIAVLALMAWRLAREAGALAGGVATLAALAGAALLSPMGPTRAIVAPWVEATDAPWWLWLLGVFGLWLAVAFSLRGSRGGRTGLGLGLGTGTGTGTGADLRRDSGAGLVGRPGVTFGGWLGRLLAGTLLLWMVLLVLATALAQQGSLTTTLFYVVFGVAVQFGIGLGLALLCAQPIAARDFFRMAFFIPLMVTPVGIAYMFRMLADMQLGPLAPLAQAFHWSALTWAQDAWSARLVVLIGDTWQWTPFIFIVMLAAIEGQPRDQLEAAQLDGASAARIFRDITWPAVAPSAAAVVLIRLIEAFKIVDLPNVLTNGGPGIATESLTLHAFIDWRTLNLGGSAAVAYMLLFVSTVTAVSFFNFVVKRARGEHLA